MANRQDIPALTGLRGAAAFWVAAYHLLLPAGFVAGPAAFVLGRGYLAVDVFFVLSGFVMALSYGRWFRGGMSVSVLAGFLLRRLARLYPLYAAILVFRLVYTSLRYGTFDLPRPWIAMPAAHATWDVPANLLMVQSWGLAPSLIGTAWSISVEWGVYFLFPALAVLLLWRGWRIAAGMACGAALLIGVVAVVDAAGGYHAGLLDAWDGQTPGPFLRCLAGFTLGMGVWRLSQNSRAAAIAGAWPFLFFVLAGLAILIVTGAPDLALYPLFPALVLSLACTNRRTIFANARLVWLGEISYALYLLHIFLLHPLDVTRASARLVFPSWAADMVAPACIFALLLAASHLSYRLIERPGRTMIIRWGDRVMRPRQSGAAIAKLTANR